MKKRIEDQLIELAFEDRSGSTPPEFGATPEVAARLREYQVMRSALGLLRDIPEHQLSTERLREALLHQGLKRRRSFPWQALSYGVGACGLFLCAFYVSRGIRRAGAPTPLVMSVPHVTSAPSHDDIAELLASNQPAPTRNIEPIQPAVALGRHSELRSHGAHDGALALNSDPGPGLRQISPMTPHSKLVGTKPGVNWLVKDGASAPANRDLTPSPLSGHATITNAMVLIQSNTDADTGLDTAQEVTATGDVLVGG